MKTIVRTRQTDRKLRLKELKVKKHTAKQLKSKTMR